MHRDQYRSPMLREDAFKRLMRIFIQCSSDAVLPNQCFCLSNGGREIRNNLVSSFVDTGGTRLRVKERKVMFHMNEESLEDRSSVKRMSEKGIEHETNHVHMMQTTTLALPFANKSNLNVSGSTRSNVLGPFNWTPTKDYEQVQLSKISEFLGTGENAGSGHESSDDEEMKTLQRATKNRPMFYYELPVAATAEIDHRLEPCCGFFITGGTGDFIMHLLKERKPVWAVALSQEHRQLLEQKIDKSVWSLMLNANSEIKNLKLIELYKRSNVQIPVINSCQPHSTSTPKKKRAPRGSPTRLATMPAAKKKTGAAADDDDHHHGDDSDAFSSKWRQR